MKAVVLQAVSALLDGLEIAFCAFDGEYRALAWNRTFLDCFPEQAGHIHVGEPCAQVIGRFHAFRTRFQAVSLEMGRFGRINVWHRSRASAGPSATATTPQVRSDEAQARLIAQHSRDVSLAIQARRITYVSPSVQAMLGWRPDELVGKRADYLCHPEDRAELDRAVGMLLDDTDFEYRLRARRKGGGELWVKLRLERIEVPEPMLVVGVRSAARRKAMEDRLARVQRELEAMAATDALTGLANRRRFDTALQDQRARLEWESGDPTSLLLLDLDHFKRLNDTQGHEAGDEALRQFGALLQRAARSTSDLAARYGGEEFALLLPHTALPQAQAIAERIRLQVHGQRIAGGALTVSVGAASASKPGEIASLVRRADRALYEAKTSGRDRTCCG